MNLVMDLPRAIRHARKELGLTQAALARLSGVQRTRISLVENGGNVTMETVRRVLRHLPNLHSDDWNQGAVAAAAFIARACQHVIDRVTAPKAIDSAPT